MWDFSRRPTGLWAWVTPTMLSGRPVQVLLGVLAGIGLGAALVQAPWVYALAVPAVMSLGVLWLVLRWTAAGDAGDRKVAAWTYASYVLHLGLSLVIDATGQTVKFFTSDAETYHLDSMALARHWAQGTPRPRLPPGKEGFFYALASLYEVIGPHRVGGLALTALCSAVVVPLVVDTTRRLFGAECRLTILPLLVLLPGFLFWTAQLLREAPIVASLALGANLAVRLSDRVTMGRLVMLGLTVAVLFTLRGNVAYVFGAGILMALVLSGRHLMGGLTTAAATVSFAAALIFGIGLGASGYEGSAEADLAQVNVVRKDLAQAESGIGRGADVSTTQGSLAYLPIGVPQFLLGPFPWQARNFRQALGLLDAATVWWLVPSLLRGLRQGWRRIRRRTTILLVPAAGITIVLSLLIGNIGTLVRERLQVLVLLMPFIALGRYRMKEGAAPAEEEPKELASPTI